MTDIFANVPRFSDATDGVPLYVVASDSMGRVLDALPATAQAWAKAQGFTGAPRQALAVPDGSGQVVAALVGCGDVEARRRVRFLPAVGASSLPKGDYQLADPGPYDPAEIALGWLLESYRFTRYKDKAPAPARLIAPKDVDVTALVEAETLARDLINTPAEDMGPPDLAEAVRALAQHHGAAVEVTEGAALESGFPLIHTVGRAAARAPRLIDLTWGQGPLLTLVGKGVCYDTGGLNLKPGGSMALMKKDMGGAAHVLALAHFIMSQGWPVRLRVLIPAVENAVSGASFRPGDVFTARNGKTVEINNTDAEGRLVLADALALAAEEEPAQIISMATLTGAARIAVGPDLAPFFTDDDGLAGAIMAAGGQVADPVWRMPLHPGYESLIEPDIADLDNAPSGGFAGATTAALFLRRFTAGRAYCHFDCYGWQPAAAPARHKGGVAQGWRALAQALPGALNL